MQQMQRRITDATKAFFFADAGHEGDDHLVEVVRRDPEAAAWFIKLTMLISTCGGSIACAISAVFLFMYWEQCSNCDRPLRWWLLVQAVLQAIQVPVRLVIFFTVRSVHRAAGDLQTSVRCLTNSRAWYVSKRASLVLYGWFILGFVWWLHASRSERCPGIELLTGAVMALSAARAALALVAFALLFPPCEPEFEVPEAVSMVEAATHRQINTLSLVRFPSKPSESWLDAGDPTCAVCIADFCSGDLLRRLPCRHNFHKGCIDKWLLRNKRCPLCMAAIDVLPTGPEASKACERKGWHSCN